MNQTQSSSRKAWLSEYPTHGNTQRNLGGIDYDITLRGHRAKNEDRFPGHLLSFQKSDGSLKELGRGACQGLIVGRRPQVPGTIGSPCRMARVGRLAPVGRSLRGGRRAPDSSPQLHEGRMDLH